MIYRRYNSIPSIRHYIYTRQYDDMCYSLMSKHQNSFFHIVRFCKLKKWNFYQNASNCIWILCREILNLTHLWCTVLPRIHPYNHLDMCHLYDHKGCCQNNLQNIHFCNRFQSIRMDILNKCDMKSTGY